MIFYFSGTGNSEWVARRLSHLTDERLISIADEIDKDCHYALTQGERIGFCFPVHGWRPPLIVRRFVSKMVLQPLPVLYCYAVCTCGDSAGRAMEMFDGDLRRRGLHTASAFSVIMPNTYVCLPFMDTDSSGLEARKLQQARQAVDTIAQQVIERKCGVKSVKEGPLPRLLTYVVGGLFTRFMVTDRIFHANTERCVHCGRCTSACPTGNIHTTPEGLPKWARYGRCTACLACYHSCPTHAISCGRTDDKGQYLHPAHRTGQAAMNGKLSDLGNGTKSL